MIRIRQAIRLQRILYILARNGLDQVLVSMGLFHSMRFFIYLNPWTWIRRKKHSAGVALRLSLEELGPIFIKLGQALSTRPDILPLDVAEELAKLQDKVPPFSGQLAEKIIEQTLGKPIPMVFQTFETEALASASIAQVHGATLLTGQEVVIKVLRPGIRKLIDQDLNLMLTLAELMNRYWPLAKRFKPVEIVNEFAIHLIDELDLRREAANAAQLRRNFNHSPLLYVPEVYWDYSHEQVMVMERISGIPVSDVPKLLDYKINLKALAERGVEIFFTQVFRDCFFHADMHPGNIFVSRDYPNEPQYICVDFGIVGTLTDNDKRYLAENLLAFFNRDYKRVAELHVESGWVNPKTRVEDFESAIRTVCEPIINKPLKDISFAQLAIRLFQVARRFDMEVQPQLILLQKTLLAVEGLGRQLYPDLNLWLTAKPFLENWVKTQIGPKAIIRKLRNQMPFLTEQLPLLPQLVYDVLVATKEEKRLKLAELTEGIQKEKNPKNSVYALGMLILIALIILGSLSYFKILSSEIFSIATISTGFIGMLMLWFHKLKRN